MYLRMLMFHTQIAFPTWANIGPIYVAILGQALVTDVSSPLGQCYPNNSNMLLGFALGHWPINVGPMLAF